VVWAVKDKNGNAVDGSKLSTFGPKWGINTGSYTIYKSESGVASATNTNPAVFDAATGNTTYTYTNAIPADAKGTIAFSADIYKTSTLKRADGKADITGIRDAAFNDVKYVSIDGSTVAPRRTSVTMAQCNQCHQDLALHGDQRKNINECVICHNPLEGDQSRRPATAGAPESVSFQRLIHRIHTGEELSQDFTVYGFGGSKNNFNEVRFPGDRRNCAKCHVNTAAFSVPVAATAGPVTTLRDYFSPQAPDTAACLGCHDNRDAAAHAYVNVATFPGQTTGAEACAACHGAGKEFSVDKVHAR
jgi:OmcA/MtrC family decaheme c-type cytochrome